MGECWGLFVGDVCVGVCMTRKIARNFRRNTKASGIKCRIEHLVWEVIPRRRFGGV